MLEKKHDKTVFIVVDNSNNHFVIINSTLLLSFSLGRDLSVMATLEDGFQ